jgi:hypothetical protein
LAAQLESTGILPQHTTLGNVEEGVYMRPYTGISRRHLLRMALAGGGFALSGGVHALFAQAPFTPPPIAPPPGYMAAAEKALAEPFKGITTDGTVVPGLYGGAYAERQRLRQGPPAPAS